MGNVPGSCTPSITGCTGCRLNSPGSTSGSPESRERKTLQHVMEEKGKNICEHGGCSCPWFGFGRETSTPQEHPRDGESSPHGPYERAGCIAEDGETHR